MTKNRSVLQLSLRYGAVVAIGVAVAGSIVGFAVGGVSGSLSALTGAVMAAIFMGLTAASIVIAERASPGGSSLGAYFGIIAGAWFGKLVVFTVVAFLVRDLPWVQPYVFFGAVVAAVIGSLIGDALAMQRARVPYVGDIALPGDERPTNGPTSKL